LIVGEVELLQTRKTTDGLRQARQLDRTEEARSIVSSSVSQRELLAVCSKIRHLVDANVELDQTVAVAELLGQAGKLTPAQVDDLKIAAVADRLG
jgi:hypothetical protein